MNTKCVMYGTCFVANSHEMIYTIFKMLAFPSTKRGISKIASVQQQGLRLTGAQYPMPPPPRNLSGPQTFKDFCYASLQKRARPLTQKCEASSLSCSITLIGVLLNRLFSSCLIFVFIRKIPFCGVVNSRILVFH